MLVPRREAAIFFLTVLSSLALLSKKQQDLDSKIRPFQQ